VIRDTTCRSGTARGPTSARDGARRLTLLATVHLAEGEAALDEARRCLEVLGVGGFKVHLWLQGETMTSPVMDALCGVAAEHDVPLMFHDGTPPYALLSQVGLLTERFPRTRFILGHSGILHF